MTTTWHIHAPPSMTLTVPHGSPAGTSDNAAGHLATGYTRSRDRTAPPSSGRHHYFFVECVNGFCRGLDTDADTNANADAPEPEPNSEPNPNPSPSRSRWCDMR